MNIEQLREYCISKPGATESFPFGGTTLVFKVGNKMFALTDTEGEFTANLKCEPEKAIELREKYPCVIPGYHMSKVHWNTIIFDGSISDKLVCDWIDNSYNLVFQSLPAKTKNEINQIK